eukprot:COSAG05_NODE_12_length_37297_cov_117.537072_19_plen_82_part_00
MVARFDPLLLLWALTWHNCPTGTKFCSSVVIICGSKNWNFLKNKFHQSTNTDYDDDAATMAAAAAAAAKVKQTMRAGLGET